MVSQPGARLLRIRQRNASARWRGNRRHPRPPSSPTVVVRAARRRVATAKQQAWNHKQRRQREQWHERGRAREHAQPREHQNHGEHHAPDGGVLSASTHTASVTGTSTLEREGRGDPTYSATGGGYTSRT